MNQQMVIDLPPALPADRERRMTRTARMMVTTLFLLKMMKSLEQMAMIWDIREISVWVVRSILSFSSVESIGMFRFCWKTWLGKNCCYGC